tara:strand:+ start:34 stop:360 length:327 start_codon:yes stop_codon:yes gene_type:complete
MSEYNEHHDTVLNIWRLDEKQVMELINKFPMGTMHPNGIAYSLEVPTFKCEGNIKLVWYIHGDYQERFKKLMVGNDRVDGHEILRRNSEGVIKLSDYTYQNMFEGEEE